MKIDSEQDMLNFGKEYAAKVAFPMVIELIGDVGAGKTTFVRGLAEGLDAKDKITSPSFTISKAYALPKGKKLVHYDFYRLTDPGLMSEDLNESILDQNTLTIIEWGENVAGILPEDRTIIKINYNDDNSRNISFHTNL